MMNIPDTEDTAVYTVTRLNRQIKKFLEFNYPYLWVKGEISNFRRPASGHSYFTLKDDQSQIRAVFFRPRQRYLRFEPEDGLQVLCQGRLSVYEPRGEYQLVVDLMEPQGLGALQLAFEQLKKKLEAEGFFEPENKLPLPSCPQRIAVITSPTGAAIRDILKVFHRSPFPLTVTLLPVRVQGSQAAGEISAALQTADALAERYGWNVILLGRGGGSLEDLWPFNEESVARAAAASRIPVISAVGHEVDLTISDLVADLRAPTPTAAAEWVVSRLETVHRSLLDARERMHRAASRVIEGHRHHFRHLKKRLVHPRRRLEDLRLFVDDRGERLHLAFARKLERARTRLEHLEEKFLFHDPRKDLPAHRDHLERRTRELVFHCRKILDKSRSELQKYSARMEDLNPLSVLSRGYSITYRLPDLRILRRVRDVGKGERIRVRLTDGFLECTVQEARGNDESGVE